MTKLTTNLSDLDRAQFILATMVRFQRDFEAGIYHHEKRDLFCEIRHPDGQGGSLPIGRDAHDMLCELAETAITKAALNGRTNVDTARSILGPIRVQLVSIERQPPTDAFLRRVFEKTAVALRAKLTNRTYFLPCHLMDTDDPREIVVGPVTFLNRKAFRPRILAALRAIRTEVDDFKREDKRLYAQAARYYRGFQWVAEVRVEGCDPAVAPVHARAAVTAALSCLQLLLGAGASNDMIVEGQPRRWDRSATLRLNEKGSLEAEIQHAFRSGANFEEGWSSDLQNPGMELALRLCGIVVESALPCENRPLSQRMLGAIQWFGEAVREDSPSTKLLKFITAIEHIMLTGERDNLTALLARRVAALCYEIGSATSRHDVEKEFRRLYDLRSKLIHGALSPWSPKVGSELAAAATLAENVANGALNSWREEGLFSLTATSKRMREWFAQVVWMMIVDTEPVAHVAEWMKARPGPLATRLR